jgi:cell wall-associated NlpC family hydrolase
MPRLKRRIPGNFAAAVIPVGVAAAFAFSATVAQAATIARAEPATAARPAAASTLLRSAEALSPARSAHRRWRHLPARLRAYYWAQSQAGHPYVWGGTGPGYDCSGLVMMAYRHAGVDLPRTTYEMLGSPMLVRVVHPRMGDLAFYGSGHVELFRRWGYTFGAHDSGSVVGLIRYGWGWVPTAFYRIR